jgi:hypothetical protein
MKGDRIDRIVNAVLYEGYMLYPYRTSSVKNRQRWNFGVVVPERYHRTVDPSERCILKTQCLLEAGETTSIEICVRFLQLVKREVLRGGASPAAGALDDCDETVEQEIALPPFHPLRHGALRVAIELPATTTRGRSGPDEVVRRREAIGGEVIVETVSAGGGVARIAVSVANATPLDAVERISRDEALRRSLLSAHLVLTARNGAFVSLLDPGDVFRDAAAACRQEGLYPVLVGEEGDRQSVLAAPIILYDHPQVAPESPDDLFDGTEIDEILTLRIQTLSEAEKREIRAADDRTRELLERADNLEPEVLARLHGALRTARPTGGSQ